MIHSFFPKSYPKILFQNATSDVAVMQRRFAYSVSMSMTEKEKERIVYAAM